MFHKQCLNEKSLMSKTTVFKAFIMLVLFHTSATWSAQTVGLLQYHPESASGYVLFSKQGTTYLIDQGGMQVHSWVTGNKSPHPGYLQENGDLVSFHKGVKRFNWEGELLWSYINQDAHHDIAVLPNGHVLMLVRTHKSRTEAIQAGRNPDLLVADLSPLSIIEVNPQGEVVWDWHVWDHLIQEFDPGKDNFGVVKAHPELIDINHVFRKKDNWLHTNSIAYHEQLDQIMISPRFFNEIWIIDHSTSRAESASHAGGQGGRGGDLLYRWGNPIAYQMGTAADQQLFGSHNSHWIEAGHPGAGDVLLFNNGGVIYGRDGNYSSIDQLTLPLNGFKYEHQLGSAYLPKTVNWSHTASPKEAFFAAHVSGVQRLKNGNTFYTDGVKGRMVELNQQGQEIWVYQNPVTKTGSLRQGVSPPKVQGINLFKAIKYSSNHAAFVNRSLQPVGAIERYEHVTQLRVKGPFPSAIAYPLKNEIDVGVGQLIPITANAGLQQTFLRWEVVKGQATISTQDQPHATVQIQQGPVTIQAVYADLGINEVRSSSQ